MVCQQISCSEWPLLFFFFLGVWPPSPHAGMTSFPCRERQLLLWIQKFQNETVPEVKGYNFTPSCKQREADLLLPANDRHVRLGRKKKLFFFFFFLRRVYRKVQTGKKRQNLERVYCTCEWCGFAEMHSLMKYRQRQKELSVMIDCF